MILTCPQCQTSYEIGTNQIGPQGRTVRCAACKHSWKAEAEPDPIVLEPEYKIETPPAPEPEPVKPKAREIPKLYRKSLEDEKRLQTLKTQGVLWGSMVASLLAIFATAYVLRVNIVRAFPNTANAFAMAGIEVNATGLKFLTNRIKLSPQLKGGQFVVSIDADVQNLRDKVNSLAPIRARLLDAHGVEIASQLIPLYGVVVDSHATRHVQFDVEDPKNLASEIDLKFDLVAMKDMARLRKLNALYQHAAEREAYDRKVRQQKTLMKPRYEEIPALMQPVSAELPLPSTGHATSLAPSPEPQIHSSDLTSDTPPKPESEPLLAKTASKTASGGLRPAH